MSDSSWNTGRDAGAPGIIGRPGPVRRAAQGDLARVGGDGTAQDPDERALAGAVLAQDGVHFAGSAGEVHIVQGDHAAVALADAVRFQQVHPGCQGRSGSAARAGRLLGGHLEPGWRDRQHESGRQIREDVVADLEVLDLDARAEVTLDLLGGQPRIVASVSLVAGGLPSRTSTASLMASADRYGGWV